MDMLIERLLADVADVWSMLLGLYGAVGDVGGVIWGILKLQPKGLQSGVPVRTCLPPRAKRQVV